MLILRSSSPEMNKIEDWLVLSTVLGFLRKLPVVIMCDMVTRHCRQPYVGMAYKPSHTRTVTPAESQFGLADQRRAVVP